jgi:hypothetical protein
VHAAGNRATEQAGGFEDAEMFGNGGKGHGEGRGESGDVGFSDGETSENGAAGGIGESGESGVEGGLAIVNHTV